MQANAGKEIDTLHIKQDGAIVRANDLQGEYIGCASKRWFVLGRKEEGVVDGCNFERDYLILAEMANDTEIKGKIAMIGHAKNTKKCLPIIGTTEILFSAKKK